MKRVLKLIINAVRNKFRKKVIIPDTENFYTESGEILTDELLNPFTTE